MHFIKAWNVLLVTHFYSSDVGSWEVTIATGKKAICLQVNIMTEVQKQSKARTVAGAGAAVRVIQAPDLLQAPRSTARTHTADGDAGLASSNPEQKVLFEVVCSPLCQLAVRVMIRCKKEETLQLEGLNHVRRPYRCKALLSFRNSEL